MSNKDKHEYVINTLSAIKKKWENAYTFNHRQGREDIPQLIIELQDAIDYLKIDKSKEE
jgi:hypothetical protein